MDAQKATRPRPWLLLLCAWESAAPEGTDPGPFREERARRIYDFHLEETIMSFFDDALRGAVPGGDLATPIAIAAGALLLHHFMGGSLTPTPAPTAPPPSPQSGGGFLSGGGLLGGLTGLVEKLSAGGNAEQVSSWVDNGANLPIQPGPLGSALGQQTISNLAARSGLSEQELLAQLSAVLPQLVNNLTPAGRLPTAAELAAQGH